MDGHVTRSRHDYAGARRKGDKRDKHRQQRRYVLATFFRPNVHEINASLNAAKSTVRDEDLTLRCTRAYTR